MATRYGKTFRTRKGRLGRYKYVNGKRVAFVGSKRKRYSRKPRRMSKARIKYLQRSF